MIGLTYKQPLRISINHQPSFGFRFTPRAVARLVSLRSRAVAEGPPEAIAGTPESWTGRFLEAQESHAHQP